MPGLLRDRSTGAQRVSSVELTNWLEPARIPVRLALLGLMLASLVMSAGLPEAFGDGGLLVGGAYAVMQIGRSAFAVRALAGAPQQRNYQRILCWCCVSGALAVAALATAALILGGPALYLAGHAAFKAVVWRAVPVPRIAAVAAAALLGLLAPHVTVLALAAAAAVVVIGVVVADYLQDHGESTIES